MQDDDEYYRFIDVAIGTAVISIGSYYSKEIYEFGRGKLNNWASTEIDVNTKDEKLDLNEEIT